MSAPPLADTVGNVVTAATIFTLMIAPLTLVCTVDPTLALLAARKRWVARPGMAVAGGAEVSWSCPSTGVGGTPPNAARRQPVARAERHRQRAAAGLSRGRDGGQAGRADRAEGLPDARQFGGRGDGRPAAQRRPPICAVPGPPDTLSTVKVAGTRDGLAGSV